MGCELQHKPNSCLNSFWICEAVPWATPVVNAAALQTARTAQHLLPVAVVWQHVLVYIQACPLLI